jgi:SEC-C motif
MSRSKLGRNDPCPCGSGTKFKHCCLAPNEMTSTPFFEGATPAERIQAVRIGREFLVKWANEPKDFLDGKTPLEVMEEPGGVEKVSALMNANMERGAPHYGELVAFAKAIMAGRAEVSESTLLE